MFLCLLHAWLVGGPEGSLTHKCSQVGDLKEDSGVSGPQGAVQAVAKMTNSQCWVIVDDAAIHYLRMISANL